MAKGVYNEGSVFLVPLRTGGFARGIVSRCDGRGLVFGYFFGPRIDTSPNDALTHGMFSRDAILVTQFSDIGLRKGEWPVVATIPQWHRSLWPMPLFTSNADHDDVVTLTEYDEDTLDAKAIVTQKRSEINWDNTLSDSVMGYGAVEKSLTQLLEKDAGSQNSGAG